MLIVEVPNLNCFCLRCLARIGRQDAEKGRRTSPSTTTNKNNDNSCLISLVSTDHSAFNKRK